MAITTSPSAEQIKQHPREFALYCQAIHGQSDLNTKELHELASKYGDASRLDSIEKAEGQVDFAEIAAALSAPATKAFKDVTPAKTYEDGSPAFGYAAQSAEKDPEPFVFTRRPLGKSDVHIQITNCGICHTDIHQARNEWNQSVFPCVPGHEIVGIVTEVGSGVTNFKAGDRAGVGFMVDSCRTCRRCKDHDEQFCEMGMTGTFNSPLDGHTTYGGYSDSVVVTEDFVLHIPDNLSLAGAAPLLCAGITVYSPLKRYGLDKPGTKVGVLGLGGVGHVAVLIGKAMGLEITVLSTSVGKKEEALNNLGADHFVVTKNKDEMEAIAGSLAGIIDCVSAKHPLSDYLALLDTDGKLITVGAVTEPLPVSLFSLLMGRKMVAGSLVGGIKETQEMLDFCGKHNITAIIEEIKASEISKAYERILKSDVRYRFVIDVQASIVQ